jgi:hypothetical protein
VASGPGFLFFADVLHVFGVGGHFFEEDEHYLLASEFLDAVDGPFEHLEELVVD